MSTAFLLQTLVSGIAVALLVALAAWARIARPDRPLDEPAARALLEEEFPDRPIDALWIAADGRSALAKSDQAALVLCRIGDGLVARQVPWAQALNSRYACGRLVLQLRDPGAPSVAIAVAAWPPAEAET